MVEEVKKENAEEVINHWIKQETQGEIQNVYQGDSDFVLCNAMYLRYVWQSEMSPRYETKDFFGRDKHGENKTTKVEYFGECREEQYCSSENYQAIRLGLSDRHYGKAHLYFVIVLPKPGVEPVSLFNPFQQNWEKKFVSFEIPKFKIKQQEHQLDEFYGLTASQLPGLGLQGNGPVSLKQAATITVQKDGITAAAATFCSIDECGSFWYGRPEPIPFHVDRPFTFLIVDDHTEAVLFQGKVFLPEDNIE